ncbi:MAG: cytochrome c3 family protein, partial [Nitrospirota bacterium]
MADTDPPHSDYRPGYSGTGCAPGTGACHDVNQGTFLPNSFNHNDGAADDYTAFCLSCHNSAGEAHNRNVGVPSTNKYVNFTGIDPNFQDTGNAHSWNGVIGNAGTRFPTLSGFMYDENGGYHANSPTLHMIDWSTSNGKFYKVRCQTCHVAMYKSYWFNSGEWSGNIDWASTSTSDNVRYKLNGYTTTKTYQNQFVQVYESTLSSRPVNSRTKERYLVSPSEYTYNNHSALVTFKTAQPASDYINVDIRQPFLRFDNSYDKMCVDCHYGRPTPAVTHAPGTGVKNGHPVSGILQGIVVPYGYRYGLHSTLMPQPKGSVMLQDGNIYCTTCHQQHNAPSNDGELTRESTGSALCSDCHKTKLNGYSGINSVNIHDGSLHTSNNEPATQCLDCHTTHNTNNIMLIRNVINGKRVNFQSFTGARSFGPDTGFGVCEVCHTKTTHHLSDNAPSGQGHNTGLNCTQCHTHSSGFQPNGSCTSCHGQPPASGNAGPKGYGWNDTTGNM